MGTITEKFHQNPLKTVGGVAETRLCLRTDILTDGRTDEPITIVPFDLRRGTTISADQGQVRNPSETDSSKSQISSKKSSGKKDSTKRRH